MQRNLFTESGINTDTALYFYNWAEEKAHKKAMAKHEKLKIKNSTIIEELNTRLQSLLFPQKPSAYSISELKQILTDLLEPASQACKKYYSANDLQNDLENLLNNSPDIEALYGADLADTLKQELFANPNQLYLADEILKSLTSLINSKTFAKYDATVISKLINQLLLQKQQVSYAGEEIANELKEILEPFVMGASFEITEDYPKFYHMVFNWDSSNYSGEDQYKCGIVQQVLLTYLGNIKENNRDLFMDQYFSKIAASMSQVLLIKAELSDSAKDKKLADMLSQKMTIMHAMISWLNREIQLSDLQEIVATHLPHGKNDIGVDIDELLKEVIVFNGNPEELEYFDQTQPLLNEIYKTHTLLDQEEKSLMNTAKMNILQAMICQIVGKAFVIGEDGSPVKDDTLAIHDSATLAQVISSNPAYKIEHKFTGVFRKPNEIDTLKQRLDTLNISPITRPSLK